MMQTFGANTHEIPLCKSLSMRCSVSISRSSEKYKKTKGFYNNAHFSFYSPDLKKKIGKEWRTTYPPTKKAMRSSAGEKPQAQLPGNQVIQNALQNLLCINSGISLTHCKTTKTGEKTVTLDNDELYGSFAVISGIISSADFPQAKPSFMQVTNSLNARSFSSNNSVIRSCCSGVGFSL